MTRRNEKDSRNRTTSVESAIFALLLTGCSLEPPERGARFFIDLGAFSGSERSLPDSPFESFTTPGPKATPPPVLPGFACLAVNVTGPGIQNSSASFFGTLDQRFFATYQDKSFCSYRGIMRGPIFPSGGSYGSQTIEVTVPTGSPRLIQVVGVNDANACFPEALGAGSFISYDEGRFFEIGRAKIDHVFTDLSVSIANAWPATAADRQARKMDCPDCGALHFSTLASDGTETVGAGNLKSAQAFTVGSAGGRLNGVVISTTVGAATSAKVYVVKDSGSGSPSAATPDIVDSVASVSIPAGTTEVQIPMTAGATLSAGVYWIVVEQISGSFNLNGNTATVQGPYAAQRYGSGGPWANAPTVKTLFFRVFTCQ